MSFSLRGITPDAIEDAVAFWLYPDEAWERWRLVPGSPRVAPSGEALRLTFELEGDRFELALLQRGDGLRVKFDDREDPERELPARVFEAEGDLVVAFDSADETVFVTLELAG